MTSGEGLTPNNENGAAWDAQVTRRFIDMTRPVAKAWFRPEVHGVENIPPDGGLMAVSNHSGGIFTTDTLIVSSAVYEHFGYGRPILTLGHNALFAGPLGDWTTRIGLIRADREVAERALQSGAIVLVFPGGLYDAYRPTTRRNVIDFNGRLGYVKTAMAAGTPILPIVSIGGQENQIFLTRGEWLARRLGLGRFRSDILPVTIGFPFGLSAVVPLNVPLPTKVVTRVLKPVYVADEFGDNADPVVVDAHVRSVMQSALDGMARQRRFPVLG